MLKGKKGIIFGIANDHSIAWGISKKLSENGAELALTYQNDTLLKRIKPLSEEINSKLLIECDFSQSNSIKKCFDREISLSASSLGIWYSNSNLFILVFLYL